MTGPGIFRTEMDGFGWKSPTAKEALLMDEREASRIGFPRIQDFGKFRV